MVTMLKNKCSVWKRIKFPTFWYNCYYFTWSDTYFILVQLETLLINHPSYLVSHVRVRTHQRSRVESNPVQSDSQRRGSDSLAYFQWPPRQCVHTSRVESSPSHESCRVKSLDAACSTFVSQTLVIGRDGCCFEDEMDVKFFLFHDFRNKSAILVTLHEFLIVN